MAKDKKLVEAITAMEDDFAQWYTDVVKKAELADYSSVRGCMILRPPFKQRKRSCRGICTRSCMGNSWWTERIARTSLCKTYIRDIIL